MNENQMEQMENRILEVAGHFPYPATPDIAKSVSVTAISQAQAFQFGHLRSRLILLAAILIISMAALMVVPPVRAQILEFIQIGAVRIFLIAPTPTITPSATPSPGATISKTASPSLLATQTPYPARIVSLLELSGETTLEKAQEMVDFRILLPDQTAGIGKPDRVYVMNMNSPMVILVWVDSQDPEKALLSLHQISPGSFALEKLPPVKIEETRVNANPAVWATGPYIVRLKNQDMDFARMVEGHVLIWEENEVTYRLETGSSIEEAVRIAELLR